LAGSFRRNRFHERNRAGPWTAISKRPAGPGGCGSGSRSTPTAPLEFGARGTVTLFINGRLHVAGYDEPTLGAALATAIKGG
jgi:hypothetical protein